MLIIPFLGMSQVGISLSGGIDVPNFQPVVSLGVTYEVANVVSGVEMRINATRNADKHNYLGTKIGYDLHTNDFVHLVPSVGYYYDYISADKVNLNHWFVGGSIRAICFGGDKADFLFDAAYINSFQYTMGIIVKL